MATTHANIDVDELAQRLDDAWETRTALPSLSGSIGLDSIDIAYEIQNRWNELRHTRGDRAIGHKIGLTSQAMRDQIGVHEPDYGRLWRSRYFPAEEGRVRIPSDTFLQPWLEGEIAFLMGQPLDGASATAEDVLAATDAVAVSVEVIDSRFADWKIRISDTIADNASYGGFATGPWSAEMVRADLRTVGMLISKNGELLAEAIGSAVLGHPANSVAWLASRLYELGTTIQPGDIVLSGSLGRALPISAGDEFVVETHGRPALTIAFE